MKNTLKLLIILILHPWRCFFCKRRGCKRVDYADGSILWTCFRCGREYWEEIYTRYDDFPSGGVCCA